MQSNNDAIIAHSWKWILASSNLNCSAIILYYQYGGCANTSLISLRPDFNSPQSRFIEDDPLKLKPKISRDGSNSWFTKHQFKPARRLSFVAPLPHSPPKHSQCRDRCPHLAKFSTPTAPISWGCPPSRQTKNKTTLLLTNPPHLSGSSLPPLPTLPLRCSMNIQ